jgi:hypothetical protein
VTNTGRYDVRDQALPELLVRYADSHRLDNCRVTHQAVLDLDRLHDRRIPRRGTVMLGTDGVERGVRTNTVVGNVSV